MLLGADGKLAGGPVGGTKDVIALMGDIADQLGAAPNENPADTSTVGVSDAAPLDPAVAPATGAAAPNHLEEASREWRPGRRLPAASNAIESHGVDALTAETPVAPDGTRAGDAPESPAASVNQAPQAAGVHNVSDPSEASDDDLLDYVPTPTPFMMFEDATGATTSLRQIGAMGPSDTPPGSA